MTHITWIVPPKPLPLDGKQIAHGASGFVQREIGAHDLLRKSRLDQLKRSRVRHGVEPRLLGSGLRVRLGDGRGKVVHNSQRRGREQADHDQNDDGFSNFFRVFHAFAPPSGLLCVHLDRYGVRMFIKRMANDTPSA